MSLDNTLKQYKNSQRIESDSDSNDASENSHSREPGATAVSNDNNSGSKSIDSTWKNTTIPLTRLKWKIPRKLSVSSSEFANHDDTTDHSSRVDFHDGGAEEVSHSEVLEPGMEMRQRTAGAVIKLEPEMEMRQRKAGAVVKLEPRMEVSRRNDKDLAIYSGHQVCNDITTTSLPNTSRPKTASVENPPSSRRPLPHTEDMAAGPNTGVHVSSDVRSKQQSSHASRPDTESKKLPPHAEDAAAGPSTDFPRSPDAHIATDDEGNGGSSQTKRRSKRRRRSKRNKRKEQLADCPNSRKDETWFDFRGIETHLTTRRRSSNIATRQQPQAHAIQNDPYYGSGHASWLSTLSPYSNWPVYNQPLNTMEYASLLPTPFSPPPPLPTSSHYPAPLLMNFVPRSTSSSYYNNYGRGQPSSSSSSSSPYFPPAPFSSYPPPPHHHIIHGGPLLPQPQPPTVTMIRHTGTTVNHIISSVTIPQPQVSVTSVENFSSAGASCVGGENPSRDHEQEGSCIEIQKPKRKRPSQQQRRRRKKEKKMANLVLTIMGEDPNKAPEQSSEPVSEKVLAKRRRRSQRKKRKREEWKIKKRELKEAGQWPPPKRRKKKMGTFSAGSLRDPTYSPSKWDPKVVAQSGGCMTRARTAATNTPRKQAMREAVREAYRHEDLREGLRFAREILAKQGRSLDTGTSSSNGSGADGGMGNRNELLTTPIREGSVSERPGPSSTPQSGYVEKSPISRSSQLRRPVVSIPETPPSTMSAQNGNRTRLMLDSNVTGPSTSSYRYQEQEKEYCRRIVDEVKRRTIPGRRVLSSVLVTPVQKTVMMRSADCGGQDKRVKPVQGQGRGKPSSSDLINQLCQNLDDLQNRNNIIRRDGTVVPISKLVQYQVIIPTVLIPMECMIQFKSKKLAFHGFS